MERHSPGDVIVSRFKSCSAKKAAFCAPTNNPCHQAIASDLTQQATAQGQCVHSRINVIDAKDNMGQTL